MTMPNTGKTYYAICRAALALLVWCVFSAGTVLAMGTPAGTIINNTVSISGVYSGIPFVLTAGNSFRVDRAINEVVIKNSDATTSPTSTNVALSFLVSNSSNTFTRFALSAVSKPTNTWTMNNVRIFRDNNSSGSWDAGDTLYEDAGTFGDVASGASVTVLIVADAPAGLSIGQTSKYDLIATAVDAGTLNVSSQTAGPNTAGIETVFLDTSGSAVGDAVRDGKHSATGTFSVISSTVNVTLTKAVTTLDQWGGNLPVPGATLRYVIIATTTGSGTANNVVISDPMPLNTTYIANTLRLNGAAVTDALDTDAGDMGGTTPNAVTMNLGNLTSVSPAQAIQFDVKIK